MRARIDGSFPGHFASVALLVALAVPACTSGGAERTPDAARGVADSASRSAVTIDVEEPEIVPVTISGETFDLELAADVPSRQRGLMYRTHIDPGGGMLFVFPRPDFQAFWMGWCLTDIDILYLDERARVTAMHQMKAEPPQKPGETEEVYRARLPQYPSRLPAQFVIELAGGTLDRLDVAVGDTIPIDVEALGRRAR